MGLCRCGGAGRPERPDPQHCSAPAGARPSAGHTTPWPRPRRCDGLWPEARLPGRAAPQSRPCTSDTSLRALTRSDDPPHAPWLASATPGASGYRWLHSPEIPPDSFSRKPYDGDLDTLKGLIEAAEADQFVRAGALEVLAYLTAIGRISQDKTQAYLLRLYDTLQPQQENFVWSGWVLAIALLGLETLSDVVHQAFERGLIDPMVMNYDSFRTDLGRTLADPERMAGFRYDRLGPLEDAIGELSGWYGFSEAAKRDQERRATSSGDARLAFADAPQSFVDRFKGVGRNDPCPCGSGKKFKKCCLH